MIPTAYGVLSSPTSYESRKCAFTTFEMEKDENCNKLSDSKFRSKRLTTCISNLCQYCPNSVQSVSHLLLHCNKPSIVKLREVFLNLYPKINKDFQYFSDNDKLSHLLNVNHVGYLKPLMWYALISISYTIWMNL